MKEILIKILATEQNHQEFKFSQYRGYWGPKEMGTWVSHSGLQNDTNTWETSDQFLTNSAVLILGSGDPLVGKIVNVCQETWKTRVHNNYSGADSTGARLVNEDLIETGRAQSDWGERNTGV